MKKILLSLVLLISSCGYVNAVVFNKEQCEKYSGWGISCDSFADENGKIKYKETNIDTVSAVEAIVKYTINENEPKNFVGEFYIPQDEKYGFSFCVYGTDCYLSKGWHEFEFYDISERVNGYIKFNLKRSGYEDLEIWVPRENVLFYKDVPDRYDGVRKKIEKLGEKYFKKMEK